MCHLKVGCPIYYKIIAHWGKLNWSLHNWSCLCSNQGRCSRWGKGQLPIPSNLFLAKSIAKNNIDQLTKGMLFFFFSSFFSDWRFENLTQLSALYMQLMFICCFFFKSFFLCDICIVFICLQPVWVKNCA